MVHVTQNQIVNTLASIQSGVSDCFPNISTITDGSNVYFRAILQKRVSTEPVYAPISTEPVYPRLTGFINKYEQFLRNVISYFFSYTQSTINGKIEVTFTFTNPILGTSSTLTFTPVGTEVPTPTSTSYSVGNVVLSFEVQYDNGDGTITDITVEQPCNVTVTNSSDYLDQNAYLVQIDPTTSPTISVEQPDSSGNINRTNVKLITSLWTEVSNIRSRNGRTSLFISVPQSPTTKTTVINGITALEIITYEPYQY